MENEMAEHPRRNLLLRLAYVGTRYHGFQIQENALTVQEVFQQALCRVLLESPDIKGCSRTDSGVHARDFAVNFPVQSDIEERRLMHALNYYLPKDIRALSIREVPTDFHARYDCIKKRYRYLVWNDSVLDPFYIDRAVLVQRDIDLERIRSAAARFVGTHDFKPFSGRKVTVTDTVRTVYSFDVQKKGPLVSFSVTADGFLYNMVRVMVGTLLSVVHERITKDDIDAIFDSGERAAVCVTAPPEGLYLDRVFYGFEDEE
jgi:tRNA pseudouridine38-40 synthase